MGSYESTMLKLEKMAQANTATQMNWQEKMSKTSHQMEVQDLIAAGLNPVLSSNQGANSYTTSVDSAVNGIAGMASAREGASATRYAARQSRLAAQSAAWAQIEAAKISAGASNYRADRTTVGAAVSAIDKILRAIPSNIDTKNILKLAQKNTEAITNNPDKFLKNPEIKAKDITTNDLTHDAKALANNALKKYGIQSNDANRLLYIKACYGDKNAAQKFAALVASAQKKKTSASSLTRTGSGVW